MAQVKKEEIRAAILEHSFRLFVERGYHRTTLAEIAEGVGVTAANIYVYFDSKLAILYALYQPWLRARLNRLEAEVAALEDPRARLRKILTALWIDIPDENRGFANNHMQAVASADPDHRRSYDLLQACEAQLARMLESALPPSRRHFARGTSLSHLILMSFDGFVINRRLGDRPEEIAAIVDLCETLLLDTAPAPAPAD